MFDIGFSEMVVIAVIALVVVGPARLPGVARTIGALLGRMQRYFNDVKSEVNRELQLEDIRKMQQDLADQARALEQSTEREVSALGAAIQPTQLLHTPAETPPPLNEDPVTGTAPASLQSRQ